VAEESQSKECQAAIEALKKAITSEPVLIPPREGRIFSVKTDGASTQGIGAVLAQRDDDGRERVVAYYGRASQPADKNWTVTEIELLAALEAIRNWRPYIWGRRFKLVIDHAALRWLHTMKDQVSGGPASRLTRWALKLSEHNFEVEHKPGANHCDADAISRLVAAIVNSPQTANQQSDMGTLDIATIRQATVTEYKIPPIEKVAPLLSRWYRSAKRRPKMSFQGLLGDNQGLSPGLWGLHCPQQSRGAGHTM
jgi:ribonuclease HI